MILIANSLLLETKGEAPLSRHSGQFQEIAGSCQWNLKTPCSGLLS
jgi:hypothetical protein